MPSKQNILGYTLMELLITIAIMVIVMAIGVPSFDAIVKNNRLESQTYDISTAFSVARMEAIDKGVTMSLCSSTDQATCRSDGDKNNWADGWILFRDINANGVVDTPNCANDANDCVIKVWPALTGASVLTGSSNFVVYAIDGRLNSAVMSLTLTADVAANCGSNQKRTFTLSVTGKLNTTESDCP
jgi:type IV fimbrial biogenesis protein FimT